MRLESQDFDNKLKSATANLQHMEREVRRTGATFEYADKEELAFLKSLGQMETKAMDAKGKIKELSNSYKELAMLYERMTDAEKASKPGQALAASLQQLKARLNDTKQSFEKVQNQIGEGNGGLGGALDQLSSKFGINITKLAGWGAAIGAAKVALDVMKDAFFANEGNLDEWGRTVESTKSLYQGFLDALNNGDISGFLSRMDEIVSGARKAYDAMDELGTFTAFNQRNVAKSRSDYAKALDEYRLNPTADNKKTLSEANERVMGDLRESHKKTEDAYQAALRELAQQRLSSKDLQDAFVKAFSEGNYDELKTLKASYSTGSGLNAGQQYFNGMRTYGGRVDETGSGQWRDMTDIEKQQFEFARALSQVNDSQIKEVQALGAQAVQITEQIYQQDRAYNRLAGNNAPLKTSSTSTTTQKTEEKAPEGSIKAMREQLSGLQKDWELATDDDSRKVLKDQIDEISAALDKMIGKTKEAQQVTKAEPLMNFSEKGLANLGSQIKGKMSGAEIGSADYKLAADQLLDFTTFENLLKAATERGVQPDPEWMASLFEDIKIGADVDKSTWQAVLDEINRMLQEKGLDPIKVNLDTGSLEESKQKVISAADEMKEALDNMSSGVGAISTIGNAFNDLKGIGEDLASAFSGEMDAWDSLMSVFNSGIGIMQTVISVMEAINTLQELSGALSDQKKEKQLEETTTVVAGKMAEQQANIQEAGTSMTAAGADAAESSAKAGKSVAGIPIVGPILAVAAIAAVLAATFAAMSKAKSAGKFAQGGIIPGNSFSGDNLTANVNSGELILNRAQQGSIAGQLNSNPMGNLRLSTEISGSNLRVVLNNDNRQRGGSRDVYGVH